jgi:hypothetical protein
VPSDRAADARHTIDVGALWVTQNLGGTPECDKDLQAVGTNLNDVQTAATEVQFVDGSNSTDPLSGLYMGPAAQAGNSVQGTVGEFFASHAGTSALTTIGASSLTQAKIYYSESWFSDPSFLTRDIATITHELLHAITGKTDDVLESNLGLPAEGQPGYSGSYEITVKLMADCVIGGHTQ